MYVDPFWFGVLSTIVVEIIGLFVLAAVSDKKGKK